MRFCTEKLTKMLRPDADNLFVSKAFTQFIDSNSQYTFIPTLSQIRCRVVIEFTPFQNTFYCWKWPKTRIYQNERRFKVTLIGSVHIFLFSERDFITLYEIDLLLSTFHWWFQSWREKESVLLLPHPVRIRFTAPVWKPLERQNIEHNWKSDEVLTFRRPNVVIFERIFTHSSKV